MAGGVLFGTCQRCNEFVWEDENWDFVGVGLIEHDHCRLEEVKTITVTGIVLAKVIKNGVMTLVMDVGEQEGVEELAEGDQSTE
ncbi:hypothetical protein [Paenibacillus xylanexedens]|uniref:Uncharacterized protein n=1 Tax=Paenibacillus xylanexedens TaxID=528191 RepID=A0ABS4RLQ1_PAEXY|nr:hypothetical protein [Paenibacillus xylanexedens]MBP2243826.1 hypothetical protein [Paenibacillus xylanexedens]